MRRRLLTGRAIGLLAHGSEDHIWSPRPLGTREGEGPEPRELVSHSHINPTLAISARSPGPILRSAANRRATRTRGPVAAGPSRWVRLDREGRIGWPGSDDLLWGSRLPADGWVMREIRFPGDTVVDECRLSLVLVIPHA